MEELILDVKILIASNDAHVWWLFYKYFDDFKSYTKRYPLHYCQLFTRIKYYPNATEYYYLNYLYIRYHDTGTEEWYQGGKIHHGVPTIIHQHDGDRVQYKKGILYQQLLIKN